MFNRAFSVELLHMSSIRSRQKKQQTNQSIPEPRVSTNGKSHAVFPVMGSCKKKTSNIKRAVSFDFTTINEHARSINSYSDN